MIPDQQVSLEDWWTLHWQLNWVYAGPPRSRAYRFPAGETLALWLLRRGEVRLTVAGKVTTATAGHWVHLPTIGGEQLFSADAEILSVSFAARWPGGHLLYEVAAPLVWPVGQFPALERRAVALLRLVRRTTGETDTLLRRRRLGAGSFLRLQQALGALANAYHEAMAGLGQVWQPLHPGDERVARACWYLERLPPRTHLDEALLAREVGLSPSHLRRLFMAELGHSPRAHYENRRRQLACERLVASPCPIRQLATELGFVHPAHFTNWFRRHQGCSPREYRQRGAAGRRA